MACARCGCGVYEAENQITLNKIWHKCCFRCRNCNTKLNKCTAKVFQGDIYCKICYGNIVEDTEKLSPPHCRPCRVVSSPSCVCLKNEDNRTRNIPPFDYCKKYNICFQPEHKIKKPKISQSCSCLADSKKSDNSYCFAFPIPREVANYYNRANMRKNKGQYSKAPNCCPNDDSFLRPAYIRVRNISPQQRKRISPMRCRSPSPKPRRTCCCSCTPQSATPPPSCHPSCPPNCQPSCPPNYQPSCPNGTYCGCCAQQPRYRSPPRRHCSPPKRCLPCPPVRYPCKQQQENQSKQQQCSCSKEGSRPPDFQKAAKYCCCGRINPCNCKMGQIRAVCTSVCVRCGRKVYAAEKISVSSGPYHNSCFSCYCCHKLLDVRNVYESCNEIYCKSCYNNFFGISYYGYGSSQYC